MEFKNTLYEKSEGIATVIINRPEVLNALNQAAVDELLARFEDAENDENVRVIVITGAGERAFCTGADLKTLMGMNHAEITKFAKQGQRLMNRVEALGKPVIAAVNGYALGGGCELALACDIRIASENAQMGQPEINIGLIPNLGGTQRLPRYVGRSVAKDLVFTGKRIDAETAERIGLVNAVVPADRLKAKVKELAMELASKPAVALRLSKMLINKSTETHLEDGLREEAEAFELVASTEDFKEGVSAFLEKRKPQFKGK